MTKQALPPPVALILGGWTMSSDLEKQDRWIKTLQWAEQNKCLHLIPVLMEEEKYYVSELTSYTPFYHEIKSSQSV